MWDFIPGLESAAEYAAFEAYRDQDPKHRTMASAARRSGLPYPSVSKMAKGNFWIDRVALYDQHRAETRAIERAKQDAISDATWAEMRAELLAKLREVSLEGLDQLAHDLATRRTRLRPNELKQITDVLLRFGNLANGDATDRVANVIDLSNASPEDLAALERLRQFEKSDDDEGSD
jgi:uncharacterized protein with PIN domain